jgi:hypothetical protein
MKFALLFACVALSVIAVSSMSTSQQTNENEKLETSTGLEKEVALDVEAAPEKMQRFKRACRE